MKKNIAKLFFALFIILPAVVQLALFIISLVVRLLGNSERNYFSKSEIIDCLILFIFCLLFSTVLPRIYKKYFTSVSYVPTSYTSNNDFDNYNPSTINSSNSKVPSKSYVDNYGSSYIDGGGYYRQPGESYIDGGGYYRQPGESYIDGGGYYRQPGESYIDGGGYYRQPGK